MLLSDKDIMDAREAKLIKIEPFYGNGLQPASYDLHLDSEFIIFTYGKTSVIDTKQPVDKLMKRFVEKDFVIYPGQTVLASTIETVKLSPMFAGRVEGKSSLARLGLMVHITAGFVDPGFAGKITLELVNMSPLPIKLYVDMSIAQICFFETRTPALLPYGHKNRNSKYHNAKRAEMSKNHLNFSFRVDDPLTVKTIKKYLKGKK